MSHILYPIRSLLESDLTPTCMDTFARRQVVQNVWRKKDGKWAIVPEPFIDDWDLQTRRKLAEQLRRDIAEGGAVFAALGKQGEIVAFSAVSGSRIGPKQEYAGALFAMRRLGSGTWREEALYLRPFGRGIPGLLSFYRLCRCPLGQPSARPKRTL